MAISLIGKNFDVGGVPLYFMTYIIFVKDVVTFGSFKSIDGDEHEIEFRLAKQLHTWMGLFK